MCKVSDLNGVGEAGKHTGPGSHPVVSKCEAIRQEEAPPLDLPKMIKVGLRFPFFAPKVLLEDL